MKNYETLAKENEQVVRNMYAAFQTGNMNELVKYLTPDVYLVIPGQGLNAGEYWGHQGFRDFYSNITGHFGGLFNNEIVAFAAGDKHVFVREFNLLNRKEDPSEEWQLPMVMMYMMRNGKISYVRVIPEFADVYDAFWTPGATNPAKGKDLHVNGRHTLGNAVSVKMHDYIMEKYHAFWNGNYEAFKAVMTDDSVFFLPGNSTLAGTYKGYDGYLQFRQKLVEITGGKYQLQIDAMAASDTDIFIVENIYQNTIYNTNPARVYVLMHFIIQDGKILRANDFPLDVAAYEHFYGKSAQRQKSAQLVA